MSLEAKHIAPVGFHFSVEFDLPDATDSDIRFQEATGISRELEVETVNEGGENRFSHKLPGRATYPNLILKRGLMLDTGIRKWCHNAIYEMDIQPTTIWVKLLNNENEPLQTYTFHNAWPKKWFVSDLKSDNNSIMVESLELCYQYFNIEE